MTSVSKISFMSKRASLEFEKCARKFTHQTHAIRIIAQRNEWLTVYARNRETGGKDFEGSFRKFHGGKKYRPNGFAYVFRNAESLARLGVPE